MSYMYQTIIVQNLWIQSFFYMLPGAHEPSAAHALLMLPDDVLALIHKIT